MSDLKYKVIIIGAGPSGLSTAINLYNLDIKDILVIEKYQFPRYKCCAGYITNKTRNKYEQMGLNFSKCHYSLIKDFNIYYKNKKRQTIINKFLYTNRYVDRVELDNAFYELAKSKGINILENTSIKSYKNNNIVTSNNDNIYYDYLVFADGTNSFGNSINTFKHKNIAMQVTYKSNMKDKIDIHFGITKKGYGWVSTSNGVTNIGLTDVYNKKINYQNIFINYIKELNLDVNISNIRGSYTPIGLRNPIENDNTYYVGDAVGACDPLTLSGLRYGLTTGESCAKSIKEKNPKVYQKYIKKLKFKFKIMYFLLKLFYLKSTLFLVFNVGCKLFSKLISKVFNNFFVNKK